MWLHCMITSKSKINIRAGSSLFFLAQAEPEPIFFDTGQGPATNIVPQAIQYEPKKNPFQPTSSLKNTYVKMC